MPALDSCHLQVVHALENAGWTVSPKPFVLRVDRTSRLHIDIEAFHIQEEAIMVVEVKCFQDPNAETYDLYTAIGQYLIYRSLLKQRNLTRPLYLAIPIEAYRDIFQRLAMPVIAENGIKMIVIDIVREVIVEWLE